MSNRDLQVTGLQIAVVGVGSIGSAYAFHLARTGGHELTAVARPASERFKQLTRDGGIVNTAGERAEMKVADQLDEDVPYDLVLVTLLAHQVDAVLPALQRSSAKAVQFMFNNFEPERLRDAIGPDRCSFGMPFIQAHLDQDGKLNAKIGAGGQKSKMSKQEWVNLFNAARLSDVNKSLLADMTGKYKPGQWKQTGSAVATSVAGGFLKKGESSLFSSLGFGSSHGPKGTAGDPMHVIVANISMSGAGGMTMSPQALGQLMGDPNSGAKSPAGGLVTKLLPMIPGFADGGAYTAGTLAMVGEKGPELVQFGSNAHITPNNKLNSVGGGHTFNIDARGSSDPAQTAALIHQALITAAPHISAATMKAMDSRNSRVAPSARR